MVKVAFDAGHGKDTYPPSKGVPEMAEYEFNAAAVSYAVEYAERNGIDVVLTQGLNHNDVSLNNRTQKAFSKNVELIISFHADANPDSSARGHWVFYWHNHSPSKELAETWDKIAKEFLPIPRRGPRASEPGTWSNFHMTREPAQRGIPAILVEHGFMTNPQDLKYLKSEEYRALCGMVAVMAVCEYMGLPFTKGGPEEMGKIFPDVPDDKWYTDDVNKAAELGIVKGYESDGTFRPEESISRAELAVVLMRLYEKVKG